MALTTHPPLRLHARPPALAAASHLRRAPLPLQGLPPRCARLRLCRCAAGADAEAGKAPAQARRAYPYDEIEPRWQAHWEERRTFRTPDIGEGLDTSKPKCYILDMFPYPSGAGLHVGHPLGYTATDILSRFKRMKGFNVLHPMGWDAFGLPAEQYAIQTGTHPKITTARNIDRFRTQTAGSSKIPTQTMSSVLPEPEDSSALGCQLWNSLYCNCPPPYAGRSISGE